MIESERLTCANLNPEGWEAIRAFAATVTASPPIPAATGERGHAKTAGDGGLGR